MNNFIITKRGLCWSALFLSHNLSNALINCYYKSRILVIFLFKTLNILLYASLLHFTTTFEVLISEVNKTLIYFINAELKSVTHFPQPCRIIKYSS